MSSIRVTTWNENNEPFEPYPNGINAKIAEILKTSGEFLEVNVVDQTQPDQGLSEELLNRTDVLVYWAHCHHHEVEEETVSRIQKRVLEGMGLVLLHSAHASKIFHRLMGTETVRLRWREAGEFERVWTIDPYHPITQGIPEYIDIPETEMYGEQFQIPAPEELLFISWYEGGEVFRSGCTWRRGGGKIFFFSPGHETLPIYTIPDVAKVIVNGAKWAYNPNKPTITTGHTPEFVYKGK